MGRDLLDMAYINSLPQPFISRQYGDQNCWWPVGDIDVETGLLRIDVCGKLQPLHVSDIACFRDAAGRDHDPDSFYADAMLAERSRTPAIEPEGGER